MGTTRRDSETTSGPGTIPLSETVMRSVIAVAEHPEDPFRLICIQTLAEISTSLPSPIIILSRCWTPASDNWYRTCFSNGGYPFSAPCSRRRSNWNYPTLGIRIFTCCGLPKNSWIYTSRVRFRGDCSFFFSLGKLALPFFEDGIDRDYGCVWQALWPCGSDEGVCKSGATDVTNLEWYFHLFSSASHALTPFSL